jgi:uncharacterized protein (TIGR00297 family)
MSQNDIIGLVVTFAFAFGLLIAATVIQKWRGYPPEFTRKIVHVGAGMAIFVILALFDNWYIGIIPTGTFIILNYISYRFRLVKAMDLSGDTLGTVYFAFSVTALLTIFWPSDQAYIAVAGTMAMTWGDASASTIGRRWGKRAYYISNHRRTLEGSFAMFCFSLVSILLVLTFMGKGLEWYQVLAFSFFLALIGAFLEAISLIGLDNILVPLGVSFSLWAMINWRVDIPMIFGGLGISILIGVYAYSHKALSFSGVLGAIITGTLIFGFGGWVAGLTLIAFFTYSTLLSKYKERQKNKVAVEKFDKGSRRDIGQALANAGAAAIAAVLYFVYPANVWLFAAFVAAMASANADTWATEIGVLSKRPPRLIITGKVVTPGTSGGITVLGTSAATIGGLVIGISTYIFYGLYGLITPGTTANFGGFWIIISGLVGGFTGSMFDSFLGATVQAMYRNPETGKETEKKVARNGVKNEFFRGWRYMDNDMVNFLSSVFGAAVGALVVLPFL